MSTAELQNNIIQKVLKISDNQLLDYFNSLLQENDDTSLYVLNEWETQMMEDGISEYERGEFIENEEVFRKNEKWLNE